MDGEKVLRLIRQLSPTKKVSKAEWQWLSEEYDLPRPTNCKACGHSITNVVRIAAKLDLKRQLHLGTDCFAFLESEWGGEPLARSSRTSSVLRSRYTARISQIYASHPFVHERRGDGSWSHWLLVQAALPSRPLPPDVKAGVAQLKRHKFILDEHLIQACVEFHNRHRTFDARVVLGGDFARFVASSITQLTIEHALALRAGGPTIAKGVPPVRLLRRLDQMVVPLRKVFHAAWAKKAKTSCLSCRVPVNVENLFNHQKSRCPAKRARLPDLNKKLRGRRQ